MLEFEEYKVKLNNLKPELEELYTSLGLEQAKREVEELEIKSSQPGFWDNPEESQKIVSRMGSLKGKVEAYNKMTELCDDLLTICEMAIEENDESMLEELESGYKELEDGIAEQKLRTLLTGEYDSHNALVSFHAGAGGTEAQDWCAMLYRMYTRWAERHGFTYKIMDYQDGDTAGIKSADILIEGENAYGFLKGENGVHRLVRISPFDASGRRQTSFSAVEVVPDIPDTSTDFEIKPDDYEMQVYRSSGAGGQHINKTSSAVRLIEIKEREHLEKISDIKGVQQKIEWGSQIRSYVFMPYTLAKDTRTGFENANINAVMDGDIDGFINAYLSALATGVWEGSKGGSM